MTRPLRVIKEEIRVLGLDLCNPRIAAAAVVRGGLFLDGVFLIHDTAQLSNRGIAVRIRVSRYFPELRAIMIHDPKKRVDAKTIEQTTRLPTLTVSTKRPVRQGFRAIRTPRGRLWVQTSLTEDIVDRIVSLTWVVGRLPEPARIAHLLARTPIRNPSWNDKE